MKKCYTKTASDNPLSNANGPDALLEVLIFSPFPPPIGGNTVHVKRLLGYLLSNGHTAHVLDYTGNQHAAEGLGAHVWSLPAQPVQRIKGLISRGRSVSSNAVVHMHVAEMARFRYLAPFLLPLFARQIRVISIHSGYFVESMNSVVMRRYLKLLFARFDAVICVNDQQKEFLESLSIPSHKLTVIPAFLAEQPTSELVPTKVRNLSEAKTKVITSGYLTDTYGYDAIIDCMRRVSSDEYEFVFAFYNEADQEVADRVLPALNAMPNVTVLRDLEPSEFVSTLAAMDIYVRSTVTDGDAVAIREALALGKRVLASDCVERPSAVELFATGDGSDLARLLKSEPAQAQSDSTVSDNGALILEVYRNAISG